ncbi:MAG: hypothetical protein PHF84_02245 [bacterium]|nr:hypothetical protein [bacterium]
MVKTRIFTGILMLFFMPIFQAFSITNDNTYNYGIRSIRAYELGQYETACKYMKIFMEKYPNCNKMNLLFKDAFDKYQSIEINLTQGQELMKNKYYAEAIPFFKNALAISPISPKALRALDECCRQLKVSIKILDSDSANGNEIKDMSVSPDQELLLWACGFTEKGDYIGPVPVNWQATGSLEKVTRNERSVNFLFSPVKPGTRGTISARLFDTVFMKTGILNVVPGRIASFKICSVQDENAGDVKNLSLKAGDTLKLYSFGLDGKSMSAGTAPVKWRFTGAFSKYSKEYSSEFQAVLTRSGKAMLTVIGKNNVRKSIEIEINPAELHYIEIEDKPDSRGAPVFSLKAFSGRDYLFYACGYDQYHNFTGNINVNWKTAPTLEPVSLENAGTFKFKPSMYFVNGYVEADKEGMIDKTGIISVFRGAIVSGNMKEMLKNVEDQNNILYFVKPNENLGLIASKILNLPYRWGAVVNYVYAISDYNKIPEANLIYPNQPIFVPFVRITNTITRANLSSQIVGAGDEKKNIVVVYHTNAAVINRMDKIILLDEYFLRTSNLDYLKAKYNYDFVR